MQILDASTLPKTKLAVCAWCYQPIHADEPYQYVQGEYFCNCHKDCLTAQLDAYAKMKEAENVQGDANVSS